MNAMTQPWESPGQVKPIRAGVKQRGLFRGLTARQKTKAMQALTEEVYGDGDPLPSNEAGLPQLDIVLRGAVRNEVTDADGGSRLCGMAFAGEFLSPAGPRTTAVRRSAIGETVLLSCDGDVFAALMSDIPRLRLNYLEDLQDRVDETRRWQVMLGRKTAMQRVASLLLSFWERQGRPVEMDLRLSRAEMGQILSLTFETVSRQIKALEKAGVVALPLPSCVRICDAQSLLAATGEAVQMREAA